MAAVDMTDDQLKQYFGRPDFDSSILSQDEKQRLVKITDPGPGQSAAPAQGSGVDPDVDGTINFARDFTRGVGGQLSDSVGGILKGFRAIPDVVRNLADPTTREATTSGFKQGAVEGGKALVDTFKDPIAMTTGIGKQPTDTSFGEKFGRAAAGLGMVGVPAVLAHAGPALFRGPEGGGILHGAEALADATERIKAGSDVLPSTGADRVPMRHGEPSGPPVKTNVRVRPGGPIGPIEPHLESALQELLTNPEVQHVELPPAQENVQPPTLARGVPENMGRAEGRTSVPRPGGSKPATPPDPPVAVEQPPTEKAAAPTPTVDDEPPAAAGEPPNRGLGGMSLQDQVFQDMMDQLHPEEEGPLPGNGTFKSEGADKPPVAEEPANDSEPSALMEDWLMRGERGPGFDQMVSERPTFTGKLFRGEDRPKNAPRPLKGETFEWPDFKAASKNRDTADTFSEVLPPDYVAPHGSGNATRFDLDRTTGHDLSDDLRGHDLETTEEVLTKGKFAVDDSYIDPEGKLIVKAQPEHDPTLGDLRSMSGATEAAKDPRFKSAAKEADVPANRDTVENITGTPSRTPLKAETASLDNDFFRHLLDERGSAQVGLESWFKKKNKVIAGDPEYTGDVKSMIDSDNIRQGVGSNDSWIRSTLDSRLKKLKDETGSFSPKAVVDVVNQVRVMSFLSGLAVPKSLLGNVNAVITAAVERGDWAPIKEAFNLPQNAAELKSAWQSTANPGAIAGAGKINIPGRVMGALDETTQKALQRAGLSKDEGQRLLLQRPNPTGNANFGKAIKSPVGRAIWPFQRTPFNQLAEGISPDLVRDPGGSTAGTLRRAGMTLGTTAAGYELGQNTKDPRILGLAAALSGVRGVPMLLGAAMGGAGKNAVAGISPIPEWGIPSSPKDLIRLTGLDPAAIRAFGLDSGSSARKSGRASTRASRKAR